MNTEASDAYRALTKKVQREIASRKAAEALLEQKSLALFETNQKLALAVAQLEKSSAENLIKLEFQNQIDALLIRFGRVFLRTNLDEVILENFTQKLAENNLIRQCGLYIDAPEQLHLTQACFGRLDAQQRNSNAQHPQPNKHWQQDRLYLSLAINQEKLGGLCVEINAPELEHSFIERALLLVAELLCGAIHRQHTIYRNIESRKVAERSERSTRDFLAMINHELRTPLNGLLGTSELLNATALDDKQQMLMNNLIQSGELLRSIINDLLDFSKINSGMFTLIPSQFEPSALVSTLNSIFAHRAAEKGLVFSIDVSQHIPTMLRGDLERISQILVNLIGNAIKFTNDGSVRVVLDWQQDALQFRIQDTGIGINKNAQKKLFQPFTQVDRSSKRAYEGTGLGLAICQKLIALMQGSIALTSKEGQGTTFYGYIPLEEVRQPQQRPRHPVTHHAETIAKLSVLVVDDILLNRVIIKEMLAKLAILPDIAVNGEEALALARKKDYQLIFMDCRMPVMDGFEATERLRAAQYQAAIIALTAGTTLEERKKCIDCGMNDILTKPYTAEDLRTMLEKWTC